MQHSETQPSSLCYSLGQKREYLAHVKLHSMATKEKVKAKNWLNLKSINVRDRKFGYVAYD